MSADEKSALWYPLGFESAFEDDDDDGEGATCEGATCDDTTNGDQDDGESKTKRVPWEGEEVEEDASFVIDDSEVDNVTPAIDTVNDDDDDYSSIGTLSDLDMFYDEDAIADSSEVNTNSSADETDSEVDNVTPAMDDAATEEVVASDPKFDATSSATDVSTTPCDKSGVSGESTTDSSTEEMESDVENATPAIIDDSATEGEVATEKKTVRWKPDSELEDCFFIKPASEMSVEEKDAMGYRSSFYTEFDEDDEEEEDGTINDLGFGGHDDDGDNDGGDNAEELETGENEEGGGAELTVDEVVDTATPALNLFQHFDLIEEMARNGSESNSFGFVMLDENGRAVRRSRRNR